MFSEARDEFCTADGGRFADSSLCRAEIPAEFEEPAGRPELTAPLPVRAATKPRELTVCTGIREAPEAGVVRAITARFWTAEGGVLM